MNKTLKATLVFILGVLCAFASAIVYNKILRPKDNETSNKRDEHLISNEVEIVKLGSMIQLIGNSNIKRYCVKAKNETPNKDDECFKDFEDDEATFEILKDNYYIWVEDEEGKISDSIVISDFNEDLPVKENYDIMIGTREDPSTIESPSSLEFPSTIESPSSLENPSTIEETSSQIDEPNEEKNKIVNVTYNYNLFEGGYRNGQGIVINYNPKYQIIQLNGTWTGNAITLGNLLNVKLNNGEKYNAIINYVSGSYETNETSKPRFVFELQYNEKNLTPRSRVEMLLPHEGKKTSTLTITGKNNGANNFRFWLYENETNTTTFKNYRIQIFITKDEKKQIEKGSAYGEQPTPQKAGYRFLGWYGSLSNDDKAGSTTKLLKDIDHTLYARWKKVEPVCTGEYENGYGLAKLSVTSDKGDVTNYKFMLDKKMVQNSTSSTYKATNNYTLLINPTVEVTLFDGFKKTITCNVKHEEYLTYNKKGYYFRINSNKDNTQVVNNPYPVNELPYGIYIPKNVTVNDKLPLVIGLHGGYGYAEACPYNDPKAEPYGEASQTKEYLRRVLNEKNSEFKKPLNSKYDPDVRAIVITPANTRCAWEETIYSVVDIMYAYIKLYNIDFDTILVTGGSQGGWATLLMGLLEEHLIYKVPDDNTTLANVARKFNTTEQAIKEYNSKLGWDGGITYKSVGETTILKRNSSVIIRPKGSNDQRSLFALLAPLSPAGVELKCMLSPCGENPPKYSLKTPIWVVSSHEEYPKVWRFARELKKYYENA